MAAVVTALAPLPAAAQTVCGERGKLINRLSSSYSESPVAAGLASNGSVVEVLASEDGSWTIIVTRPNGMSCVVVSGEAWQDVRRVVQDPVTNNSNQKPQFGTVSEAGDKGAGDFTFILRLRVTGPRRIGRRNRLKRGRSNCRRESG